MPSQAHPRAFFSSQSQVRNPCQPPVDRKTRTGRKTRGGCLIFPRHGYYMHSSVYAARTKYSVSLIPMHSTHFHSIHAAASPMGLGR
ncbi:hypothetical protein I7I50_10081 [Histoplasma capsulatum G186AR]|uniref:Uncharacterized protein n=1 Tax=Ajellomyces capsulatus TaxID=5037 RepID=A0A8H7Z8Y0_AJECA|nr:hypothetical protein I7I52_01319 [Histoplasma capsulatum]QSS68941.1 hypothetical protein I7I50_10081 [Histoplasma capsulatum G186AR]